MSNFFVQAGKLRFAALVGLLLLFVMVWTSQTSLSQDPSKEFQSRIQSYVELHKKASGSLPPVPKNVTEPSVIAKHEQALAQAIRALRPAAKRGDIFTPAVEKMVAGI